MKLVVMKFGGTSVEDATAIRRTADIVAGRVALGLQPVVVVSAMARVTDQLLNAAAAAGRGDKSSALAACTALRARHHQTAGELIPAPELAPITAFLDEHFDALDELLRGLAAVGEVTPRTTDIVASYGERLSSPIVAAAFVARGISAAHVDARTVIITDAQHM
jgi:aspartate kinase